MCMETPIPNENTTAPPTNSTTNSIHTTDNGADDKVGEVEITFSDVKDIDNNKLPQNLANDDTKLAESIKNGGNDDTPPQLISNDEKTDASTRNTIQPNDSSIISSTSSSDGRKKNHDETIVKKGQQPALEDKANCISIWLLTYLTPLLKLGSTKVLDQDDVGQPPEQDRSERAYIAALNAWQVQTTRCDAYNLKMKAIYDKKISQCKTDEQRKKVKVPLEREPSIATSLINSFGKVQLILGIIYYIAGALLAFVPVLILRNLVQYFQDGEWNGFFNPWVEVTLLGVMPVICSILQTRHQVIMAHCAVFVRTAVSTMLYRKALRVSAAGRAKTSTGQVVNMMSNDTAQLQRFLQFIGMTMVAPIQIIIALVLINQQVRMFEGYFSL